MKFDNRMKALANLSWLLCFTVYVANVTAQGFASHMHALFVR